MTTETSDTAATPASPVTDPAKGISLFLGMMFVLASYSLAEAIIMLSTGSRAGLLELILFSWLAVDAIVLLIVLRSKRKGPLGLMRYLGVWILGLIPYFGWLAVAWLGERVAKITQRPGKAPVIALLLFIGIMLLCLCVYLFASGPAVTSLPSAP